MLKADRRMFGETCFGPCLALQPSRLICWNDRQTKAASIANLALRAASQLFNPAGCICFVGAIGAFSMDQFEFSGAFMTVERIFKGSDFERRESERAIAVLRPAILSASGFEGFCLLKNISRGGARLIVKKRLAEGTALKLQLNERIELQAEIVWASDREIGIRFDTEIDVTDLLAMLSAPEQGGLVNRSPRLQFRTPVKFISNGDAHTLETRDVSFRGLCVVSDALHVGQAGKLALGALEPRDAAVRWKANGRAGIYLLAPLKLDEVPIPFSGDD